MDIFHYKNNRLFAANVDIAEIAKKYGTPCYIYSRHAIEKNWQSFDDAFAAHPHLICYSVKANSNIAILNLLARLGSGFDVVSGGELGRVIAAKGDPQKVVFSGVGKTVAEIEYAINSNILCFNVESLAELIRIDQIAEKLNKSAPISIRINPDIDAKTHPYIATGLKENKFGIDYQEAIKAYEFAAQRKNLKIVGIASHIGSQIMDTEPFVEMTDRIFALVKKLKHMGIKINYLDLGGGFGVRYKDENPHGAKQWIEAIENHIKDQQLTTIIEPGRAIVANAGILLTKVEYLKHHQHKNFAIVDAGMNDLIRPALYEAWHDIIPIDNTQTKETQLYDVVGPVCETSDFLGKDRNLSINEGDLLAVCTAGAYSASMSSNYNSRPNVAEILVDDDKFHLIRQRETMQQILANEKII